MSLERLHQMRCTERLLAAREASSLRSNSTQPTLTSIQIDHRSQYGLFLGRQSRATATTSLCLRNLRVRSEKSGFSRKFNRSWKAAPRPFVAKLVSQ